MWFVGALVFAVTSAHAGRGALPEPLESLPLIVEDVTPTGDGEHVVFLTDAAHARIVPIQVGEGEAIAIAFRLADRSTERPLTHDLLQATIQALGAQVVQVRVHDLADGVFHATVILRRKRALIPLEARASDAIVLALGADLPVWMDRALYDRAGVSMEDLLEGLERLDRLRELPPDPDQAL